MKNFLIAIAILLALTVAFSTIESKIEFAYPFGNWAVPGNTGQPVPGEGEPEKTNTFSFGTAEQTQTARSQETTDICPITVTVVTEQTEGQTRPQVLAWVLTGIYSVILVGIYVFAVYAYAQYFKERKKNKGGRAYELYTK